MMAGLTAGSASWLVAAAAMVAGGLAALAWSSGVFVDGAARVAKSLGISPFVVGMVVIGFGTSAPELCVSVLSGLSDHANLSLGNAYGSCVFNIAVILGVSAFICPLVTRPSATVVAGVGLAAIAGFSMLILRDGRCTRADALSLLAAFAVLLPLYCWYDQRSKKGAAAEAAPGAEPARGRLLRDFARVAVGLVGLVASSHVLVQGAVSLARGMGVSDLVIGLTVVAAGTSLPELASAIVSARRGEHEFVLGNIIGSNLFNSLAVVGLACVLSPVDGFSPYVLSRDLPLNLLLSLSVLLFGLNWRRPASPGVIRRRLAVVWLLVFAGYTVLAFLQETGRM